MATYTEQDISNPRQKMVMAGPKSAYGYIFKDSYIEPEVGETISIWGEVRTIRHIERMNQPGVSGAVVRAI